MPRDTRLIAFNISQNIYIYILRRDIIKLQFQVVGT